MDIEDICMQLSLRKTIRNIFSIFLILMTTSSCFDNTFYKLGKPYFLCDSGVRFLKSDDGLNIEIDGFEMNKEIIKREIWEENYYISKNDLYPTSDISLFKQQIMVSTKYESTYYDCKPLEKKFPRKYTYIKIPHIDCMGKNLEQLHINCPKEVVLNIFIENSYLNNILKKEDSMTSFRFELHFVVSDKTKKMIFDRYFYEKYPDWANLQDITFTLKIWPLEEESFVPNSNYFLEKWNGHYFEFKYPDENLCQRFESSIYYYADKNIYLEKNICNKKI